MKNTIRFIITPGLFCLLALALTACETTIVLDNNDCVKNTDCRGGQWCVDGSCVDIGADGDQDLTDPAEQTGDQTETADTDDQGGDRDPDGLADGDLDPEDEIDPDGDFDADSDGDPEGEHDGEPTETTEGTDADDRPTEGGDNQAPDPILAMAETLAFGAGPLSQSAYRDFSYGIAPGVISATVQSIVLQDMQGQQGCSQFQLVGAPAEPADLYQGSNGSVGVKYLRTQAGNHQCLLRINLAWPAGGSFITAQFSLLTGATTGSDALCIAVTPQDGAWDDSGVAQAGGGVDFGGLPLGAQLQRRLTVANCGYDTLSISGISQEEFDPLCWLMGTCSQFTLSEAMPVAAFTLTPGQSRSIDVTFAPTRSGSHARRLIILSNAAVAVPSDSHQTPQRQVVGIQGQGVQVSYSLTPRDPRLAGVPTGCCTPNLTMNFGNTGTDSFTVDGVEVDPPFQVSGLPTLPTDLSAGATMSFSVRFCPTQGSSGTEVEGSLSIAISRQGVPLGEVRTSLNSGITPAQMSETFTQTSTAMADILWVVDSSGSMYEEQTLLAESAGVFAAAAVDAGADLNVAVITMDNEDTTQQGRFQGTPAIMSFGRTGALSRTEFEDAFAAAVQVGTYGSGTEVGLATSLAALTPPLSNNVNAGFLRDEATLAVVYVSDEEDQSSGGVADYRSLLTALKHGDATRLMVFGILGDCPGGCSGNGGEAYAGCRYADLTDLTQGSWVSICDTDYDALVQDVVERAMVYPRSFPLKAQAVASSLTVKVNGVLMGQNIHYTFDNRTSTVIFFDPPAARARIDISYQVACAN